MSAATVYTGENYTGDSYELKIGAYNAEDDDKKTIIGVIANVDYPIEYKGKKKVVNFKNDSINSLIINPFMKVVVFEEIDEGGRWIVFENATDNKMEVADLKFANFSNKISGIEASKLPSTSKKYQSTKILDAEEKETFNSVEKYNFNMLLLIVLCVLCVFCFVM